MIEIIQTGALNTVQDLGRFGLRRFGVNTSGAMDRLALRIGNILLGNEEGAAAIEIQTFPFLVRFVAPTAFAITGSDARPSLDGRLLPPWWTTPASAGQTLELHAPTDGARCYLCLAGGIDIPVVLGSRSTHLRGGFGGFRGRALAAGDRLASGCRNSETPLRDLGVEDPRIGLAASLPSAMSSDNCALVVRVRRAGDYGRFAEEMQQRFWETRWRISRHSDRIGYRLTGANLMLPAPIEMRSHGVIPGVVQVPPSGEPIIQLSDGNTAGGYPKIAGVIDADLWRLGQARLGSSLRFVEVSYAEALAACRAIEQYVAKLRRLLVLRRDALASTVGE